MKLRTKIATAVGAVLLAVAPMLLDASQASAGAGSVFEGYEYGVRHVGTSLTNTNIYLYPGELDTGTFPGGSPSCNGRLVFQGDGNLVVYRHGVAVFSTATNGQNDNITLQTDGNVVIRHLDGQGRTDRVLWASNTVDSVGGGTYTFDISNVGIAYIFSSNGPHSATPGPVYSEITLPLLYNVHQYPAGNGC